MVCLTHSCDDCKWEDFSNDSVKLCPICGSSKVYSFIDENDDYFLDQESDDQHD
jgi:uncharacterized Zn finger protein (UPF0148 family)